MNFSLEEQVRYGRQMQLPEIGLQGQMQLKNSSVAVIGAGGLGCPLLTYLTAAGVGYLKVIDNDVVSLSNLQRQVLYTSADVGKKKVFLAKARLEKINPHVKVKAVDERLTTQNAHTLLKGVDIVVDGSDNFTTRYLVNDTCVDLELPFVAASIFRFEGQLAVYNFKGSPDYRALFPTAPHNDERPNCAAIGVVGVLPGILGTLQASEVLKLLLDIPGVLAGKLFVLDALTLQSKILDFKNLENSQQKKTEITDCAQQLQSHSISYSEFKNDPHYYLVDVRSEQEHQYYSIGGHCIPLPALHERFSELPRNKNLLLYCKSGVRSERAFEFLATKIPDKNLFQLQGGIEAVPSSDWQR